MRIGGAALAIAIIYRYRVYCLAYRDLILYRGSCLSPRDDNRTSG